MTDDAELILFKAQKKLRRNTGIICIFPQLFSGLTNEFPFLWIFI